MSLSKNELVRKSLHIGSGIVPLICLVIEKWQAITFWLILLFVAILVEYWRRKKETTLSRLFYRIFGSLLRHQEKRKLAGVTYLFISGLLVYTFFSKGIATLSMLYLSVGDGFATIFGMTFGKHHIGGKTLEGSLAFIISSLIVSFIVPSVPLWVRGIGAVSAGLLELIRLPENDNLWIPIGAASIMWMLTKI